MPVTAKLSRRFYERFGDEITNELVDWLNSVDATYQASLRDLNESNFARSDAKMEQRFAASEAKMERRLAEFASRMDGFEARIEARIAGVATKEDLRELAEKLGQRMSAVETANAMMESRLLRWTIGFWATTLLAMFGLFIAALQLR
jgi:hypothetical protein